MLIGMEKSRENGIESMCQYFGAKFGILVEDHKWSIIGRISSITRLGEEGKITSALKLCHSAKVKLERIYEFHNWSQ